MINQKEQVVKEVPSKCPDCDSLLINSDPKGFTCNSCGVRYELKESICGFIEALKKCLCLNGLDGGCGDCAMCNTVDGLANEMVWERGILDCKLDSKVMENEKKEEGLRYEFVRKYLRIKEECVSLKIYDIDEIIKLFEVYITSLK